MNGACVSSATVRLDLPVAASKDEAVRSTAELLRGDPRVGTWDAFWASIGPRQVVELGAGDSSVVLLAHGRSGTVKDLALAASKLAVPLDIGDGQHIGLVFVFAIPLTMAEEYLRAVGSLARVCGNAKQCAELRDARTADKFAGLLEKWID